MSLTIQYIPLSNNPVLVSIGGVHTIPDQSFVYRELAGQNVYLIYPSFKDRDETQVFVKLHEQEIFRGKHIKL